jgi:YQGE family putative transporter
VFAAGLLLFVAGALSNALLFNATGVLLFMLCLLLAKPLLDLAYFPIQMLVIDTVSGLEGRDRFGYILNHEFGLYLGRLVGCGLFLALASYVSQVFALKFALLVIGALQLLSIFVARDTLAEARMASAQTVPAATTIAAR